MRASGWAAATLAVRVRVVTYGLLAIGGLVLTARFNLQSSEARGGFDLTDYVRDGFANSAATSFTIDIIVAALAGLVFMCVEGRRLGMRSTIPLMIATFAAAFAFSFPAFLALRELRLARAEVQVEG